MTDLSPQHQSELLAKIMAAETFDSVAPAICAEPGCGHTAWSQP